MGLRVWYAVFCTNDEYGATRREELLLFHRRHLYAGIASPLSCYAADMTPLLVSPLLVGSDSSNSMGSYYRATPPLCLPYQPIGGSWD